MKPTGDHKHAVLREAKLGSHLTPACCSRSAEGANWRMGARWGLFHEVLQSALKRFQIKGDLS